jgi:hypothetical protein
MRSTQSLGRILNGNYGASGVFGGDLLGFGAESSATARENT